VWIIFCDPSYRINPLVEVYWESPYRVYSGERIQLMQDVTLRVRPYGFGPTEKYNIKFEAVPTVLFDQRIDMIRATGVGLPVRWANTLLLQSPMECLFTDILLSGKVKPYSVDESVV